MRRHLILGGAGFIGSHFVDLLLEKEETSELWVIDNLSMGNQLTEFALNDKRVLLFEGPVQDPEWLHPILSKSDKAKIWHMAANSDIAASVNSPGVDVENTFATTCSLATFVAKNPGVAERIIFSSSSAVFGWSQDQIRNSSTKKPHSAYGWMKLASERLLQTLYEDMSLKSLLNVRFPNVTGGRQTHGVVKDLVAKYFDLDGEFQILGNGTQSKPFVHVEELCDVLYSLEAQAEEGSYTSVNLAPNSTTSVKEIVEIIERKGNLERNPIFGEDAVGWLGDINWYTFDTEPLSEMGISLAESKTAILRSVEEEIAKRDK